MKLQLSYSVVNSNLKSLDKKRLGIAELRQLLSIVTLTNVQSEILTLSEHFQRIYYLVINTALDDIIGGIFTFDDLQIQVKF
jgi:hypothetical protein